MLSKKLKNSLSTHSRAIPQVLTHGLDTRTVLWLQCFWRWINMFALYFTRSNLIILLSKIMHLPLFSCEINFWVRISEFLFTFCSYWSVFAYIFFQSENKLLFLLINLPISFFCTIFKVLGNVHLLPKIYFKIWSVIFWYMISNTVHQTEYC